jgi:hypothetical protein
MVVPLVIILCIIWYNFNPYLTRILTTCGLKEPLKKSGEVLDGLSKIFVSYIKNASQSISASIFVSGGFHTKTPFDDYVSVIHIFIKKIFRTAEKASPSPYTVQRLGSCGSF